MDSGKKWLIAIIAIVLILCCCLLACLGVGYWAYKEGSNILPTDFVDYWPTESPAFNTPSEWGNTTPVPPGSTPAPMVTSAPASSGAWETLGILEESVVPFNNPVELAERLEGKANIPETVPATPAQVGDRREFWVTNVDTNENFRVTAVMQYETDHVYFWIEEGVSFDEGDLESLVESFENDIYPTNREFFGSEWSPGVDSDPHLYILYAGGLGWNLAGYFSSADEVHISAHEYSNMHEMFLLNSDNVRLEEEFTYGVLAHEFQHMIHWKTDRNEESWLNEGFSELSALLNNLDPGGFDYSFAGDPDLQLNDWPNDPDATTPHYGAGFLYTAYFLDRFGEDATKALVAHPDNGMDSVDLVMQELNITDPLTGKLINAEDIFGDWVVANYLQDGSVSDGRYTYHNYNNVPNFNATETISDCSSASWNDRSVSQYGTDYIALECSDNVTLEFVGATTAAVLDTEAHSGDYAFWSNKGDESDMRLTREFDFTGVSAPIELNYWTWYDLEEDYDYLYLVASTDGGETWQIINTPSCTTYDPSGNSFGCGYNGVSDWKQETVDLSDFAGQKVQLRFEYITDAAVNGEGFLLDDMEIPAINYTTDFETDDGGWLAEGFVRIQNQLPQTFRVSLISNGGETTVQTIELDETQSFSLPLNFDGDIDDAVLVVSGTTRFTRQPAIYRFRLVQTP